MNSNFILGIYYPSDSYLHRLDPRIKFLSLICLITTIFLPGMWEAFIYISVFVFLLFFTADLPKRVLISVFKSVVFMSLLLFIINVFAVHDENSYIFVREGPFWITSKTITMTIYVSWRIIMMMVVTVILTMTTKPLDITLAIEDLMFPLKYIKFPVHIIAMILSISLRFIPTILEEAIRIMKAQASRGLDIKHGPLSKRLKAMVSLIIPLFVNAFQKAHDLSNAMEARGYDPYKPRSRFHHLTIKIKDIFAFAVILGLLALIICTSIPGLHMFWLNVPVQWLPSIG